MLTNGTNLITILIELVVGGIIIYCVYLFINMLSLPEPIATIVKLIAAVIGLLFLGHLFGVI